jgi:hypothetical protein
MTRKGYSALLAGRLWAAATSASGSAACSTTARRRLLQDVRLGALGYPLARCPVNGQPVAFQDRHLVAVTSESYGAEEPARLAPITTAEPGPPTQITTYPLSWTSPPVWSSYTTEATR